MKGQNCEYEVLSPWAEADPIPLKGLAPRLANLEGKTIGLLFNFKVSARPILTVVEEKLKQRYPTLKTSWRDSRWSTARRQYLDSKSGQEAEDPEFRDWVKGVDAVIASVGD